MCEIGCILMASGLSRRYGKNKLLEEIDGRALILRTADSLFAAGLHPLTVTRSPEVQALVEREGLACVCHNGPRKSDTIHAGLENLAPDCAGFLFMPADQPLALPGSIMRLVDRFLEDPARAVRLGFGDAAGSPVIFPAACREDLLAYEGDRGGAEVLKNKKLPCEVVQAGHAWELWDADTPESLKQLMDVYDSFQLQNDGSMP